MINKVREAVLENAEVMSSHQDIDNVAQHRFSGRKYMAWNASSAALAEVIEYLEELIDLTKLLVGANEFRSGLLIRPTYTDYKQKIGVGPYRGDSRHSSEGEDDLHDLSTNHGTIRKRKGTSTTRSSRPIDDEVPISLRRIQSRKTTASV